MTPEELYERAKEAWSRVRYADDPIEVMMEVLAEARAEAREARGTGRELTSSEGVDLRRWGRCRRCGAEVSETHAIAGHHHAGCAIGLAWTMLHRALEGEA